MEYDLTITKQFEQFLHEDDEASALSLYSEYKHKIDLNYQTFYSFHSPHGESEAACSFLKLIVYKQFEHISDVLFFDVINKKVNYDILKDKDIDDFFEFFFVNLKFSFIPYFFNTKSIHDTPQFNIKDSKSNLIKEGLYLYITSFYSYLLNDYLDHFKPDKSLINSCDSEGENILHYLSECEYDLSSSAGQFEAIDILNLIDRIITNYQVNINEVNLKNESPVDLFLQRYSKDNKYLKDIFKNLLFKYNPIYNRKLANSKLGSEFVDQVVSDVIKKEIIFQKL